MEDILQSEIVKLEEELTKLKSAVEYIETAKISIEAAAKIINTITKLKEEFEKLSGKAYTLIDKFDKMEIPTRMDRIDAKVDSKMTALSGEIQALQARIETGDKALFTEMKNMSRNMSSELSDNRIKMLNQLEKQTKDIKLVHYGFIGVFALLVIIGVMIYLRVL